MLNLQQRAIAPPFFPLLPLTQRMKFHLTRSPPLPPLIPQFIVLFSTLFQNLHPNKQPHTPPKKTKKNKNLKLNPQKNKHLSKITLSPYFPPCISPIFSILLSYPKGAPFSPTKKNAAVEIPSLRGILLPHHLFSCTRRRRWPYPWRRGRSPASTSARPRHV